ncbi:MAG: DUF4785 family protein [Pseudomonadota bacterium]|nr:DUF4785 family protein [Pseudomonadota bacterium]
MRTLLFTALAAASFTSFAAQPLLPASEGDQVPQRLVSIAAPTGDFERAPVSFSWGLDPAAELSESAPHLAESREYWQTVNGTELARGIDLDVSAPGALIRISPARSAKNLSVADLALSGNNGRSARLEKLASDVELQAAGMDVDAGTVMVRMGRENAPGRYKLRAPNANGRYVMHVFEPDSQVVLKARANRNHALVGETVSIDVALTDSGKAVAARAEALLVSPDGNSHEVEVKQGRNNRLSGSVQLPSGTVSAPGLWELQVFSSGKGVQRDARTAFAVAQPTARLKGQHDADARLLRVSLPVEAASAGRYEVRGTLFATGPDGTLGPVVQSHTAAWFESGNGVLVLDFDRGNLPSGYGAPFEVRQLELHDQTRMAPLEIRARGLRF